MNFHLFLESIPPLQRLVVALTAIIVLILMMAFVRLIRSQENPLQAWEFFATRGSDNLPHPDWDKVGKGIGVAMCIWLPAIYAYSDKMDAAGIALVMGVALGYLGGVASYSATLRARQGSVITETKTEPAVPTKITETKTEMPPIKDESK